MSDTKNVAFRSAIGGYNREDVNKYIIEINRELEAKDTALKESEKNASDALSRVSALESEADTLKADKIALEGVQASLREALDQLKEENAALKESLAAVQREAARLAALEAASSEDDKSQKYDRISAQIGDIMISANTSADAIVAAANDHAAKIISDTESEALRTRARLSEAADEMLAKISSELHSSAESCAFEVTNALCDMRDSTAAMVADFEKRSRDLSMKVEYYQTTLTDAVNAALHELDEKYGIRHGDD